MKKLRVLVSAAMAGMLLMTQPAFAAGNRLMLQDAPVITAGMGRSQQAGEPGASGSGQAVSPGEAPGQGHGQSPAPGNGSQSTSAVIPGGSQGASPVVPGQSVSGEMTGGSAPVSDGQSQEHAPQGDAGTVLSPVIVAGGGQGTSASSQGLAPGQTAEQAAAEAAARQAAEAEAARQAAEAQAAAEAAAKQAAEAEAAKQAAAQSGGRQIDPSRPMVALTFDDGPQSSVGNRIMDTLAQYGGKATFFMVGDRVGSHKKEVQRMVAEGHEVANHTMNHKYLQKLGAAEIQAQVKRGNDAIEAACGVRPKIMRLPGGNHNATVRANVHMPMIQWNIDTLDWKTKNADKTVASVLNNVKDGDIILMHELYSQSGDAAVRLIPELVNRGYQLVTVSEMAAAKGYTLQAGKLYSSFR